MNKPELVERTLELGAGDTLRSALPMNRANLRCLGLSVGIAIAVAGCTEPKRGPDATSEFTIGRISDTGLILLTDNRTTCEYIGSTRGGFILRSDGYGNVTPNCAGSHGYAAHFPYGERPDQRASAIEAQRAGTPQSGPVHESAVAESQTPNPSLRTITSQGGTSQ
jgi:hypothetical protein